jgi:hypothetical protein
MQRGLIAHLLDCDRRAARWNVSQMLHVRFRGLFSDLLLWNSCRYQIPNPAKNYRLRRPQAPIPVATYSFR